MGWQQDVEKLRAGGFSESDIAGYAEEQRATLAAAGFSDTEIGEYFGVKEFNPEPVRRMFQANIDAARQANTDEAGQPRKELSFTDYLEAGWQTSVAGLVTRGKAPEAQVPPDAPMWGRLVAQGAALAGDAIPMAVGAVAGGAAGSAAPVVGTTVGAGAGAFALPAALRETLMQAYTKGEVTSWADFYGRASAVFLETLKGAAVGGATSGLGAAAKVAVGARGAAPLAAEAAGITAEVATMTTLGSAMEGRVPEPKDFLDAAVLVFGLRGATAGAAKLRDIYAKTGIRPEEVAQDAQREATIKQDLYASNKDIPGAYEAKVERPAEGAPPPPGPEGPKGPDAPLPEPPKLRQPSDVPMKAPEAYATDADALAAAKAHVRGRISIGESAKEPWSFREFYKNTVDSLDPVLQAVEGMAGGKRGAEELLPRDDAYRLARQTKGSAGKAFMFLERRTTKYGSNETTGEALKTLLDPVMKEREAFTQYVAARQALEETARGRETGIDPYAAALVVKDGQAKFETAAEGLRQFNARLYRYMADAGFYSHETVENIIANNQTYTPFHAVIETRGKKVGGLGAGLTVRDPVKGRKGSDLRKIDPLETTVKNVYLFTALADRNAAIRAYVEHAEKSPVGEFFGRKVSSGKSAKGADAGEMTTDLALLALGEDVPAEAVSPFRPQAFTPAFDEIAFFRNGKREVWRVDPEVASAFKGLDVETVPWLVEILSIPAKSLRAGAVLSPDFALKNVARDTVDAFINSKSGFVPVLDTVRGLMELWKQGKPFEEWLLGGGANAATTSLDRAGLQRQLRRMLGDPGAGVIAKAWNVANTPFRLLQAVSETLENATRLGESMKASRKARAEGMSDWDAILHGGFESREVTFDFGRMGAKMKAANMLVAFLNANVQGTDKLLRTFKDNPLGATAKAVAAVTLPSVLLYFANKDDDRWKSQIPDWQKDNFWILLPGDEKTGAIIRIPKPHTVGLLFGSMVERLLDAYFGDNPNAFKNAQWTIFSALAPNVVPTVAQPILEQWANRSFFTGQNLVPSNLERGLPEYQYSEYTTELSKLVGRLAGSVPGMHESQAASPMVLDNYVRNWTGTLGVYAWQITDKVLREAAASDTALGKKLREWKAVEDLPKPALTLADIPLVKAFVVRHPSASAQVIQDFHDEYERSKKIQHTVQMLTQRGDVDARQREQRLNLRESMIRLDGMNDALGQMRREIKALSLAPDSAKDPVNGISADERRQLIDGIYFQMIEMAKGGMQIIRAIDQGLGG